MISDDMEDLCNEAFADFWDDEGWKREEHLVVFREGFAAGIAYLLAKQAPWLKKLRGIHDVDSKTIEKMKDNDRKSQET